MKRYILLFSIVFSITVGYSQNDSIPIKDSVQKDKKYYREKAKNFMINTFGKENFLKIILKLTILLDIELPTHQI